MRSMDQGVEELAVAQQGRFTRAQVRQLGLARSTVQSHLRTGRWRRLSSKVLCLPGAPAGSVADLWTAVLQAGPKAVVGHVSAAALHGFPSVPRGGPRLLVPNGTNLRSALFRAHQSRDLTPAEVVRVEGLPVTSIPRTLIDLAPEVSASRLEHWLDHLTAERGVEPDQVAELLDDLHGPGKRGLGSLIAMIGERLPGAEIEQGPLERALTGVARLAEIGVGVPQLPHPGRFVDRGLVDRAYPEAHLIIEADGRRWHERRQANLADLRRDRAAAAEGWMTVRFTHDDLVRAPDSAAEELRQIHSARTARRPDSSPPGQRSALTGSRRSSPC